MVSKEVKVSGFFGEEFHPLCSYSDAAYLEGKILYTNTDKLVSNPKSVIPDKVGKR